MDWVCVAIVGWDACGGMWRAEEDEWNCCNSVASRLAFIAIRLLASADGEVDEAEEEEGVG